MPDNVNTSRTYRRQDTVEAVQWDGSEEGAAVIAGRLEGLGIYAGYAPSAECIWVPFHRKSQNFAGSIDPGQWITFRAGAIDAHDPAVFAATWEEV